MLGQIQLIYIYLSAIFDTFFIDFVAKHFRIPFSISLSYLPSTIKNNISPIVLYDDFKKVRQMLEHTLTSTKYGKNVNI